jgi:hypothetical protein
LEEHIIFSFKVEEHETNKMLAVCFLLVSCLAYSLSPEDEGTVFFWMSGDFCWATQYYIPEDRTLQVTWCYNTSIVEAMLECD